VKSCQSLAVPHAKRPGVGKKLFELVHESSFALRVLGAGGLVEKEKGGIGKKGSGKSKPLGFATRERFGPIKSALLDVGPVGASR
jgi:hypothetical protein